MKSDLALLKRLRDADAALAAIEDALGTAPERRAAAEADAIAARAALAAKQQEKEEAEKARRAEELECAAAVERVREREAKLYAIKTNKEYQAVLKEIAEGKKSNREREDRILTLMERIEQGTKEITQLLQAVADTEAGCREALETLAAEARRLETDRQARTAERERLVAEVGKEAMRLYAHVRQRHREAVAEVQRGICQGCHMRLPPQQFIELQRGAVLAQCPSCHRILVPADEAVARAPA